MKNGTFWCDMYGLVAAVYHKLAFTYDHSVSFTRFYTGSLQSYEVRKDFRIRKCNCLS